jgi:hypothetical protein
MASSFNTKAWEGLAPGLSQLAGQSPMSQFGQGSADLFGNALNQWRQATKGMSEDEKKLFGPQLMQNLFPSADTQLVTGLMDMYRKQMSPEEQERQLELADKYQTKKGWKSAMFNTLTSGLDNLTKGIAMSMNPYGTPEAARYAADMIAGSGAAMANAYAAARNPMAIPAVNPPGAISYF